MYDNFYPEKVQLLSVGWAKSTSIGKRFTYYVGDDEQIIGKIVLQQLINLDMGGTLA